MSDFDDSLAGTCDRCGSDGHLQVDPYCADVNNETVLVYLCADCCQERVWDI